MHSLLKKASTISNIRNGVCILPSGIISFAVSKKLNPKLRDGFAKHFKQLGCENALYLYGSVSRVFLPQKNGFKLIGILG